MCWVFFLFCFFIIWLKRKIIFLSQVLNASTPANLIQMFFLTMQWLQHKKCHPSVRRYIYISWVSFFNWNTDNIPTNISVLISLWLSLLLFLWMSQVNCSGITVHSCEKFKELVIFILSFFLHCTRFVYGFITQKFQYLKETPWRTRKD